MPRPSSTPRTKTCPWGPRFVLVEARRERALDGLQLADALQAVGVGARRLAIDYLRDHLRVAGRRKIVDQVLRGGAVGGFGDKLPEAVVNERDLPAVHRDQLQPGVVGVSVAAGEDGIAVGVVALGLRLIVGVVGAGRTVNVSKRRGQRKPLADRIEAVADAAIGLEESPASRRTGHSNSLYFPPIRHPGGSELPPDIHNLSDLGFVLDCGLTPAEVIYFSPQPG